ncbi:hypothetical protein L9F63_020628 [Diploptera punctata]|uniref:Dehydrogenase/reductase SDR family member 11 n=1 Tax=Diploptera punctata TaxID=6984 RepID=A0AAD7ZQT9_DIPPU|nr:hypothetical protein L9F63_020628 [Diploptera punctata]
MERWVGRVAVVTGASVGIGAALVEELVKKGLLVVGIARRVEKVEELARNLKSEKGKLHPLKCDVSKETEIRDAFKWIKSNLGGVDILVNNAAIAKNSNLMDGPFENWKTIIDLNVLGLSLCTSEALAIMRENGVDDGHIIHINSMAGHSVPESPLLAYMYSVSKHAVTVLAEGLRRELRSKNSKIRVTSVSPGKTFTEFMAASGRPFHPVEFYTSGPYLTGKDIADSIVFALSAPPHVQLNEISITPVDKPQ